MVDIIQAKRSQPSLSERFGQAFANAAQSGSQIIPEMLLGAKNAREENANIQDITGLNLSSIKDPKLRQNFVEHSLRSREAADKLRGAQQEKVATIKQGLQTIEHMQDLLKGGNLGRGSAISGFISPGVDYDRAQYAQLGRSLIPLVAANVQIRNKQEFDEYKQIMSTSFCKFTQHTSS